MSNVPQFCRSRVITQITASSNAVPLSSRKHLGMCGTKEWPLDSSGACFDGLLALSGLMSARAVLLTIEHVRALILKDQDRLVADNPLNIRPGIPGSGLPNALILVGGKIYALKSFSKMRLTSWTR